ncbi:unnamed protein product [Sphagnum jensenii]|uniref:Uncharacterized protein n=1 Tax=Sphagnum jensenii TaxID=128206 RepID=A0ABP1A9L1_9BRYO
MLPPPSYQGHSYSSLWAEIPRRVQKQTVHLLQHTTLVRQHKRTGSNHVSIYYILVHMKLGTAAMFVLVPWLPPI